MNGRPFFDTNVVLYAFRKDDPRSQVAESLLSGGGTLSVQILNEFVSVAQTLQALGGCWPSAADSRAICKMARKFEGRVIRNPFLGLD
jgi:predicted nucleic acid-binding protein